VDEGAKGAVSYNITSYIKQLPKYNLNVVRYGTNISEFINNQQTMEITPTMTRKKCFRIGCTMFEIFLFYAFHCRMKHPYNLS